MKNYEYELIVCIVNDGFSEVVMDAARNVGARGGTVVNARGTANKQAENIFNIVIQPEKEMVMIVVPANIKQDVLHAIYQHAGLSTHGQGIAFSLPVDNIVGIKNQETFIKEDKTEENKSDATF